MRFVRAAHVRQPSLAIAGGRPEAPAAPVLQPLQPALRDKRSRCKKIARTEAFSAAFGPFCPFHSDCSRPWERKQNQLQITALGTLEVCSSRDSQMVQLAGPSWTSDSPLSVPLTGCREIAPTMTCRHRSVFQMGKRCCGGCSNSLRLPQTPEADDSLLD